MSEHAASVAIVTHGCKLNQFEGEALAHSLARSGFRIVDGRQGPPPDVTIVNTCTVTGKSDRKSRHTILRASRAKGEGGVLIVTGCYAQTDRELVKGLEGVDYVFGNGEKARIPEFVAGLLGGAAGKGASADPSFAYEDPLEPGRSRVFVKVQDGCDSCCSYCKVPHARGASRSRDFSEILEYVRRVSGDGYEEIVLTGVNLGDYRFGGIGLAELLALLLRLPGFRIRLSSIEPMHFGPRLLDVIRSERIAPHFHVPLQSGSDRILARMGRPYRFGEFLDLVERIRATREESHIATDLIVGYPGETGEDFKATVAAACAARFASIHVFKFSPRGGTGAASLRDDVPFAEKEQRSGRLIETSRRLNYGFRRRFLGSVRRAVVELRGGGPGAPPARSGGDRSESGSGLVGITDNYIRVKVAPPPREERSLERRTLPIRIVGVGPGETIGVIEG